MNMLVHIYYVFFNFRMGEPDECGGIVSFLCSDDASYITGETVVVSGGMLSRL
jgi:dehydrogenase/reductase SDR family protein 4